MLAQYQTKQLIKTRHNYLVIDTLDLSVLILQLRAHIDGHVTQIPDHGINLSHILLHLLLASVVSYTSDVSSLRSQSVAVVHHSLRLVVHHLPVVVALPCALVLLKRRAPTKQRELTRSKGARAPPKRTHF